jgi:hypothetical protein
MLIGGQRDKVCRQLPSRSTTGDLTDAKGIEFRNFANCGLSRIDQKIINPTGSQNTESVCEQVRCSDAYGQGTIAYPISPPGAILGYDIDGNGVYHGFLRSK